MHWNDCRGRLAVLTVALFVRAPIFCASLLDTSAHASQEQLPKALVFASPGLDGAGSIPIGNGELGANLWIGPDGALHVLLARGDTFSEACRLLKVGALALEMDPPLVPGEYYRETLDVARGEWRVEFDGGALVVFVEPDRPVIRIAGEFDTARNVRVVNMGWRTHEHRLVGDELPSSWTMRDAPSAIEVLESADTTPSLFDAIGWLHQNSTSVVPLTLEHQGLASLAEAFGDPLIGRTFGAVVRGAGFAAQDVQALATKEAVTSFDLLIAAPAPIQPRDGEERHVAGERWMAAAHVLASAGDSVSEARAANAQRWSSLWSRSWIVVDGDAPTMAVPESSHALRVGRDSSGNNVWRGEITAASVLGRPLPADEVAILAHTNGAATSAPPELEVPDLAAGLTLAARVRRPLGQGDARIFDRLTAGGTDGFLFDTHPGNSLRLIVGVQTLIASNVLPDDGAWHHVAATYDTRDGSLALYLDGDSVANSGPAPGAAASSPVTQGYALQRYVTACAGRGAFPIKFNGSIFTVEPRAAGRQPFDADWRRWGDCYWWQNTRLPYHAMLAAGDFDLMAPLFDFHASLVPGCRARAELYHGVSGVYFPETVNMFGCYSNGDYGWDRDGHEASLVLCPWWQWAWNQGLELVALMLDRNVYEPDFEFARDELVPMAREVLTYFDSRFERDADGQLVISPTQALETHWYSVANDLPCVAGLTDVLARLADLPEDAATDADRELWLRLSKALPPLPVREFEGVSMLAPAERYDGSRQNIETPELYALFPFRRFALGRAGIELAQAAFTNRVDHHSVGWTQDGVFAARLGARDDARLDLVARAANSHPSYRFPATWGPNFDWLPDQCHGANLMLLTQEMLLQCDGRRILLFPAWPKEWNVDFKLHAALDTTVHVVLEAGEVRVLEVEPSSRRDDVEIWLR